MVSLGLHKLSTGLQTEGSQRRLSLPGVCAAPQPPCLGPQSHPVLGECGPAGGIRHLTPVHSPGLHRAAGANTTQEAWGSAP